MGLRNLFGRLRGPGEGHDVAELAGRLDVREEGLASVQPAYREFNAPKWSGGTRVIAAPGPALKDLQRRILRRLLRRLRCHPAVHGFERGRSIATNALPHVGKAVVVRMDLKRFFESTSARRVGKYFRLIGWNRPASDLLVRLCAHRGGLPQGAPTSPRLSSLVNYPLDTRLAGLAAACDATYTRYADDLTFSFGRDDRNAVATAISATKVIVSDYGYVLHQRRKLHIRRQYNRQIVTGLVVNERLAVPREFRRWLRAVEHHLAAGRDASLTPAQLAGWHSYISMVEQASSS